MYTNKADQKTCKDSALLNLVDEKTKSCRRRTLLTQLGSDESLSPSPYCCCDVCGPLSVSTFKFLAPVKATRKPRRTTLRNVSPQVVSLLKARLLRQRKCLLDGNMKYKALGGSVACPIAIIDEICNRIKYIKDLQDVCVIPCLPHVFAESFFNVIKDVLHM